MSAHDDNEADDLRESEFPDDADTDTDESDLGSEPCPYCGEAVYEDAELCPHCRSYISREDSVNRKPLWFLIAALILLAVTLFVWLRL